MTNQNIPYRLAALEACASVCVGSPDIFPATFAAILDLLEHGPSDRPKLTSIPPLELEPEPEPDPVGEAEPAQDPEPKPNNRSAEAAPPRKCAVLDAITQGARTTAEIVRASGVPRGSIHNLLSRLIADGFVERDESTSPFSFLPTQGKSVAPPVPAPEPVASKPQEPEVAAPRIKAAPELAKPFSDATRADARAIRDAFTEGDNKEAALAAYTARGGKITTVAPGHAAGISDLEMTTGKTAPPPLSEVERNRRGWRKGQGK